MYRFFLLIILGLTLTAPATAETVLFESGTLGTTGVTWDELVNATVLGSNINPAVFNGVRFELTEPVQTTQVGGHFVGDSADTFFGAVIALDDANDFPDSSDLESIDVLGHADLTFPTLSNEVFGDLELTLQPGFYALVFGSGLFNTTGSGAAVRNNPDLGEPSYINYQDNSGWINWFDAVDNHRFVVKGRIVPEPSTVALTVFVAVLSITRRL